MRYFCFFLGLGGARDWSWSLSQELEHVGAEQLPLEPVEQI